MVARSSIESIQADHALWWRPMREIGFSRINRMALVQVHNVLAHWLPGGEMRGREYVARNPNRVDQTLGSFKVSTGSGRWGDFAIGVYGGDLISLCAYLRGLNQKEAAIALAESLGVDPYRTDK